MRILMLCVLALGLTQCKPRFLSSTKDVDTTANASDFYLRISSFIDESAYRDAPAKCYDEKLFLKGDLYYYLNPAGSQTEYIAKDWVAFAVSSCLRLRIEQVRKSSTGDSVYGFKIIDLAKLRTAAEYFYCRNKTASNGYLDCIKKKNGRIIAAQSYLLQMALPKADSVPVFSQFAAVRNVKPVLLEKERLLKTDGAVLEKQLTAELGRGDATFTMPVLALTSMLSSYLMYSDSPEMNKFYYVPPGWMLTAKDEITKVMHRDLAVQRGFASAQPSDANTILNMPAMCQRRIDKACLGFPCTSGEEKEILAKFGSEQRFCRPKGGLAVAFMLVALPVTVMDGTANVAFGNGGKTSELIQVQMDMLDKAAQNTIYLRLSEPEAIAKFIEMRKMQSRYPGYYTK